MTFQELINSEKPILVDFFATWCGPCKAMNPILKEVAKTVGDTARIVQIDVDKNRAVAQKMGVQSMPTFILFQNGEVKWRQSGMQSAKALSYVIEQAKKGALN
ncbi:MAG: thioredoxin [Saprospiraceae bacterium]